MNFLKITIIGILIANHAETNAQSSTSEPIFGSVLERKTPKDSTKKRLSFNPLRPAFLRIGVMGGFLVGFKDSSTNNTGGTRGLRLEYGFSNQWSLVGEVGGNSSRTVGFPRRQASLGVNWMPFKSRRLQPFFGLGGGAGNDSFRSDRGKEYGRGFGGRFNEDKQEAQGFAFIRTGLNYVLFRKIIATVETTYQKTFDTSNSSGGLSLKAGIAYQFNRKAKK